MGQERELVVVTLLEMVLVAMRVDVRGKAIPPRPR